MRERNERARAGASVVTAPQTGQSTGACAPDITETEIETVYGQHGRDAVIDETVEGPRTNALQARTAEASAYSIHGTVHGAPAIPRGSPSYVAAFDAAEACGLPRRRSLKGWTC